MFSTNSLRRASLVACGLGVGLLVVADVANSQGYGGPYPFGRPPTAAELAEYDIDVRPDGTGLPAGQGNYADGKVAFMAICSLCHGEDLKGGDATKVTFNELTPRGDALVGGRGTLTTNSPVKTVESYWPYATTLFDYIRRAMPFVAPGSLTDNQVYALVAFILGEAKIIEQSQPMNKDTLWRVQMPNKDGFIADPRPDKVIWFD